MTRLAGGKLGGWRQALALCLAGLALWMLASDGMLAPWIPDPVWRDTTAMAITVLLAALTAGLLWRLTSAAERQAQPGPSPALPAARRQRLRQWAGLVGATLVGSLVVADSLGTHTRHREEDHRSRALAGARQLDIWLAERLSAAQSVASSPAIEALYSDWAAGGRPAAHRLPQQLSELSGANGWRAVSLHAADGTAEWGTATAQMLAGPELHRAVRQAALGDAVVAGPWLDAHERPQLVIAAPLRQAVRPAPVLVMHLDADAALGPLLENAQGSPAEAVLLVAGAGGWTAWSSTGDRGRLEARQGIGRSLPPTLPAGHVVRGEDGYGRHYAGWLQPLKATGSWWFLAQTDDGTDRRMVLREVIPVALSVFIALGLIAALLGRTRRDAALIREHREREYQSRHLQSLQMLDAVLDGAGIVMVVQDLSGQALLCSREAARVAGLAQVPEAGTPLQGLLPSGMLQRAGQGDADLQHWPTPVGSRIFTTARGALRDGSGATYAHYVVARDVTTEREAAQALARSEQQLALALHGAELGLWDWQVTTGDVQFNDRWCTMLGYRPEEVTPDVSSWQALVHPDDQASIEAALMPHLEGRTPAYRCEHRLRHRDGHWVWVLDAGRVVERDADGHPVRAVGIHLDISERHAAVQALERARDELERRVAERTQALARATEQARAASQAKSAFLANMSHEIRTPLNAILGLTRLLTGQLTDVRHLDRLTKIERAGMHLATLIDDILDLSKIEAGRLTLERVAFDPGELLEQVRGLVAPQAETRGLALVVAPGALPPRVYGDPTRLRQALLNLAGNAVKFTVQGAVTLRADMLGDDGTTLTLRFEVEDTGIGIESEAAARLFQPFEQADATTTRRFGGTGLGLAITRRLAEAMGGEVGLASVPGQGSRFWFTCRLDAAPPVANQAGAPEGTEGTAQVPLEALRRQHAGRRVLLAEDEPVNQEIASALLEQAGLLVHTVDNGLAAVAATQQEPFDIVMLDLHMPVLDGLAAAERLRAEGATMPIVAITASAFDEDRRRCEAAGMNAFVPKPLNSAQLYATLLKAFQSPGAPAAVVPTGPPVPDLLQQLKAKLQHGDVAARDLALQQRAWLIHMLGDHGRALVEHVLAFDHERALDIVDRLQRDDAPDGPAVSRQ